MTRGALDVLETKFHAAHPETDGLPYQSANNIQQNNNNQRRNGFLQYGSKDGGQNISEASEFKQRFLFEWINNNRDPRMNGLHPSGSRDGGQNMSEASELEFSQNAHETTTKAELGKYHVY